MTINDEHARWLMVHMAYGGNPPEMRFEARNDRTHSNTPSTYKTPQQALRGTGITGSVIIADVHGNQNEVEVDEMEQEKKAYSKRAIVPLTPEQHEAWTGSIKDSENGSDILRDFIRQFVIDRGGVFPENSAGQGYRSDKPDKETFTES